MNLKALALTALAVVPMMTTPAQAYSNASQVQAAANRVSNWGPGKTARISHLSNCKWEMVTEWKANPNRARLEAASRQAKANYENYLARYQRDEKRWHTERIYQQPLANQQAWFRHRDQMERELNRLHDLYMKAITAAENASYNQPHETNRKESVTCRGGYAKVTSPMGTMTCKIQYLKYTYETKRFNVNWGLCNSL